jgi:hypothetical protein
MSRRLIVDLGRFRASHGTDPRDFGLWIFEHAGSRNRFEFTGTYADAVSALRRHADELAASTPLPGGDSWWLLP